MNLQTMTGEFDTTSVTDPAMTVRMATASVRQARRLARLVDDLLDTSRIHQGVLPMQPEPLDLGDLVREVVARFHTDLRRAGCEARLDAAQGVVGRWDPLRLEQVVVNLLSNAAKFGPGRPIEITVDRLDGRARLKVRDRGIGIDPIRQTRIFERFERGVSAEHYGGLGLGLYISRHIIESHGGALSVESKPDQGSTFTVTLPV